MFAAARTVCRIATDCSGEGRQPGHTVRLPATSPRPTEEAGCWARPSAGQASGKTREADRGSGPRLGWVAFHASGSQRAEPCLCRPHFCPDPRTVRLGREPGLRDTPGAGASWLSQQSSGPPPAPRPARPLWKQPRLTPPPAGSGARGWVSRAHPGQQTPVWSSGPAGLGRSHRSCAPGPHLPSAGRGHTSDGSSQSHGSRAAPWSCSRHCSSVMIGTHG